VTRRLTKDAHNFCVMKSFPEWPWLRRPKAGRTAPEQVRRGNRPGWRRVRKIAHTLTAVMVSAAMLDALALGFGPIPALGWTLDPGQGVWGSAAGGVTPRSQTLQIAGLRHPVSVSFTAAGVPSIRAEDDADLYLAQGYVEASFRLEEMDLERRLGEGRLAQLVGPPAVSSDEFELRLGLLRTAAEEWAQTPPSSPAGQELLAYSRGVNDYIAQARSADDWPAVFTLAGVYPATWTPVDSLVVQGLLSQRLDLVAAPLDYALLERSLGSARTAAWFPVEPPNSQRPYDPGPYPYAGITPIAVTAASTAGAVSGPPAAATSSAGPHAIGATAQPGAVTVGLAASAAALLAEISRLPAGQVVQSSASNAWAANGPAVSGGHSMLAGDPHLSLTLPSVWYQMVLDAPGLSVSGVGVPGLPGIVIGHNAHIAWSLTDVQNQSSLYYAEQTSTSRPGEYFWRGRWRRMWQAHYTIDVRDAAAVHLTVDITVHGPIMTMTGRRLAVDWMGNVPSPDIAAMAEISMARNFAQFRAALAGWKAPAMNFVYADDSGNIGAISAGYYPVLGCPAGLRSAGPRRGSRQPAAGGSCLSLLHRHVRGRL
jgi:penicillin G amidase